MLLISRSHNTFYFLCQSVCIIFSITIYSNIKALKMCHEIIINECSEITFQAAIYLLKVNNRNTRTRCGICSISHLVLVFPLLTLNM